MDYSEQDEPAQLCSLTRAFPGKHLKVGHNQPASEMPFTWRFPDGADGGPTLCAGWVADRMHKLWMYIRPNLRPLAMLDMPAWAIRSLYIWDKYQNLMILIRVITPTFDKPQKIEG